MRCIYPKYVTYRDIAGKEHYQQIPCGHCIACLHNEQDSWCIRLTETNNHFSDFIYDTLTLSPSGMSYRNVTDKVLYNVNVLNSPEVVRLLERYQCVDSSTGEVMYLSPFVDRKKLQDWLKRGRENFYNVYKRRCHIKYFIVSEYGPKTSRFHFHLLMWGISHSDYVRFFAKPWRRDLGFTKTHFIHNGTDKDRQCIARYVSKYVSKGVFESPLVKCGLAPKPYRSISHGIGEEYLQNDRFKWFKSDFVKYLKRKSVDLSHRSDELSYRAALRQFINSDCARRTLPVLYDHFNKLGNRLTTYYDSNGFPHSLPRYYRHKLANYKIPNFLSFALQEYLLENARVYYNKGVQEFAHSLGYTIADKSPKDTFAGFGRKLYNILDHDYFASQVVQAKAEAKRRFTMLKNHYGRAMNLQYAYAN